VHKKDWWLTARPILTLWDSLQGMSPKFNNIGGPNVIDALTLLSDFLPLHARLLIHHFVCVSVVRPSQCRVARSTKRRSIGCRSAFTRTPSTTTVWNDVVSYVSASNRGTRARTTSAATSLCHARRRTPSACAVECPSCRSAGSTRTRSGLTWRLATRSRRSRRCSASTGRRSSTKMPTSACAGSAFASEH